MPTYLSPGVYVEEVANGAGPIEGVGTAIAAFVGITEKGRFNTPTLVTNWSQYVESFGDFVESAYLPLSVYGFFQNGGGQAYIVRVALNGQAALGDGDASAVGKLASATDADVGSYIVKAIETGDKAQKISIDVQAPGKDDPKGSFKIVVKKANKTVETFGPLTTQKGKTNVQTVVNSQSKIIRLERVGDTDLVPAVGSVALKPIDSSTLPEEVNPTDYVGDPARRSGFGGLEAIPDVTMVVAPDIMALHDQGALDREAVKAVQTGMIAHCEIMGNRMAILDTPRGLNAQEVKDWRVDFTNYDSAFAAMYWPWVGISDPLSGKKSFLPPSGMLAGIWGRNDDTRGVHKAPANEVIRGAIDLELSITRKEHDLLNPVAIDVIRTFPGRGIRVWGARTLTSDPSWRYLNVRRYFNYLEDSILLGTQWCVFEPNDQKLWARITRTINAFLIREWRSGALFGASPAEAYFVKCDAELNTRETIDAGQVLCEIGVSPVKPAEFVIFRLSQFSGGADVAEE